MVPVSPVTRSSMCMPGENSSFPEFELMNINFPVKFKLPQVIGTFVVFIDGNNELCAVAVGELICETGPGLVS